MRRRSVLKTIAAAPALPLAAAANDRPWLGPEFWANPLQDWRLRDGRMECFVAGGDRNVFWLTRELASREGAFDMSVRLGRLDGAPTKGWAGFRIGVRAFFPHYKDVAIRGVGLEAGVLADGRLFIAEPIENAPRVTLDDLTLRLRYDGRQLELTAGDQRLARDVTDALRPWLAGGVALVCSSGEIRPPAPIPEPRIATAPKPGTERGGDMRCWFRDWTLTGSKVDDRSERAWGPLLFNQYTLSRGVMKMTVQLAPVERGVPTVALLAGGKKIAEAPVDPESCTACFRIAQWNDRVDTPYEVVFQNHRLKGTIRRDPRDKPRIVVGSLTCQNDFGFPHEDVARNLEVSRPDILFFTGDQVYERNGEYGIQRRPAEAARLDYLRKWMMFGWAWGGLTKDIPCVCLPDDHDVYHGNIWGAGGRRAEYPADNPNDQPAGQDSGGYTMPAPWVNIVQRTQSSHLPDAWDAAPIEQNIAVLYGHLVWGGVSFALLEDRKFKSPPKQMLPEAKIRNGWIKNPAFDSAKQGDVPGAQLLGERQEKFLAAWADDWSGGIWMKCVVSATIFSNLATLPKDSTDDSVTSKLAVMPLGGYAPNEKLTQDHDSNGWPQTPRNRALRLMRSCLAVHLAGDQHLGSTIQYGVDAHGDAPWAICAPAVSNLFPRRWFPPMDGENRQPGMARNHGDYFDGFGNRVTVHAVANPAKFGKFPAALHERACGWSIIEFDKATRQITLTNWPRWADLTKPGAQPYPGWPITIRQVDNGLSKAPYQVRLKRKAQGVVRVTREDGSPVWTWRVPAAMQELPVWSEGRYRVKDDRGDLGLVTAVKRA